MKFKEIKSDFNLINSSVVKVFNLTFVILLTPFIDKNFTYKEAIS